MKKIYALVFLVLFSGGLFPSLSGQQIQTLPDSCNTFKGLNPPQISAVQHLVPFEIEGINFGVVPVKGVNESLLPHAGIIRMIQQAGTAYMRIPGLSDDRDLPLSPNGKLVSVDGFEVEFAVPNNPNDPGICGTPSPEVVIPSNARMPAGCPFVVPCDQAVNRDASIPLPADPIKYMQLRWTVVRDGAASSNIDLARVNNLMTEVNSDFLPYRIQFCLDTVIFVNDAAMYNLNVGTEDGTLKTTYGANPGNVINIYVVNNITNPSAGGYARFPYDPFGGYNIRGGVVMGRSNSNLGTHTLAHELGHTFGLHHTFRGVDEVPACTNCYEGRDLASGASSTGATEGDWCEDTNPHPTNSYVCGDAGTDGCAPGLPWLNSPVDNHMSYSFCTTTFTSQQAGRMHCMIDSYLSNWTAFGGGTCGAQPPTANFIGSPTTWQAPSFVTFTDLSVPGPLITSWEWDFDFTGIGGATPATFVGQNPPVVRYDTCDTAYTVRLIVSNSNGADTLVRNQYINVTCPAGECDTLDQQWETPAPSYSTYSFGPNDYLTGVPAPTLSAGSGTAPIGFYEFYNTPTPGVTTVGAVRVALGNFLDADSSMTIQISIYNDSLGFPMSTPLGGRGGLEPGGDLGVPAGAFYTEQWIPFFNKVTIDSPAFHVGLEIFGRSAADRLLLISSAAGQGQALGRNNVLCTGFGWINYNSFVGIDFDLHLVPMLGEWPATPVVSFAQLVGCDTTALFVFDTVLFSSMIENMSVEFVNQGIILSDSDITNLDTLISLYYGPGPETVIFTTINNCGRTDTSAFTVNYSFDTIPIPDFTISPANPVCAGAPGATFTASPPGMTTYLWDFGDGTVASSGASNTTNHQYATPGLYYVTLTVQDGAGGCVGEVTKLDIIEIVDCSVNAPLAGFRQSPDSICVGNTVAFVDTTQGVPDTATTWQWDFGDGNFSLSRNPTHTYNTPGTFIVRLVAGNAGGTDTAYYSMLVLPNPCTLPIDARLIATARQDAIALNWTTLPDFGAGRFVIERSIDGISFAEIGEVPGSQMNFTDRSPVFNRLNYYRIKQVDQNGGFMYTNTASAVIDQDINEWVNIYPNPVDGESLLNVDATWTDGNEITVELFDLVGRNLGRISETSSTGYAHFEISTDGLPQGSYFAKVTAGGKTKVKRFTVK